MPDGFDLASGNGDPRAFDFVDLGVRFKGRATWGWAVFIRYGGSSRPVRHAWHGLESFSMLRTVQHVFLTAYKLYDGADVYVVDSTLPKVVAHAHKGQLVFDAIDRHHVYDARLDYQDESGD